MPTVTDLHPRTRLAEWAADPEVVGVAWIGSRSRGYGDAMSDDDLEVLLVPEAHARIRPGDEFEMLPDPDADPPRLIYDARRTTLAANAVMPEAFRQARVRHGAIDAIAASIRARKSEKRQLPYATRMLLARGAKALTRVLFALEGRWTPLDHWLEPELAPLADAYGVVPLLRAAILEADPAALDAACEALRPALTPYGFPPPGASLGAFHAQLLGPGHAAERAVHALD